jgi:hypothetical protein
MPQSLWFPESHPRGRVATRGRPCGNSRSASGIQKSLQRPRPPRRRPSRTSRSDSGIQKSLQGGRGTPGTRQAPGSQHLWNPKVAPGMTAALALWDYCSLAATLESKRSPQGRPGRRPDPQPARSQRLWNPKGHPRGIPHAWRRLRRPGSQRLWNPKGHPRLAASVATWLRSPRSDSGIQKVTPGASSRYSFRFLRPRSDSGIQKVTPGMQALEARQTLHELAATLESKRSPQAWKPRPPRRT